MPKTAISVMPNFAERVDIILLNRPLGGEGLVLTAGAAVVSGFVFTDGASCSGWSFAPLFCSFIFLHSKRLRVQRASSFYGSKDSRRPRHRVSDHKDVREHFYVCKTNFGQQIEIKIRAPKRAEHLIGQAESKN